MSLNFPSVEDVHLSRAPLREVICQVRFPLILRIANEEPHQFQEKVRKRFPVLNVQQGVAIETDEAGKAPKLRAQYPEYRFQKQDGTRVAVLAPNFFALSTTAYTHWDAFADDLFFVSEAIQSVYAPSFANRIGLRYINVISASAYSLDDFDAVLRMLRSELVAMLQTEVMPLPEQARQEIRLMVGEDRFTFRHGLIREKEGGEPLYLLDFDHYIEGNVDLSDLQQRCNRYHEAIYRAFRWCILPTALACFGPETPHV